MSVCLFVMKDLANRWTYVVLVYRVASHRSWVGLLIEKKQFYVSLEASRGVAASVNSENALLF